MIEQIGFYVVSTALLVSALRVVTAKNLVHTVLWLGLTLAFTAITFLMLHAPFMAAIQIILYTGGVLTLMLFGVMLTHRDTGLLTVPNPSNRRTSGVLLGAAVFAMVLAAIIRTDSLPDAAPVPMPIAGLGLAFLTEHVLAFEVLSLLLLAAVLGAIVLARKGDPLPGRDVEAPRIAARPEPKPNTDAPPAAPHRELEPVSKG